MASLENSSLIWFLLESWSGLAGEFYRIENSLIRFLSFPLISSLKIIYKDFSELVSLMFSQKNMYFLEKRRAFP